MNELQVSEIKNMKINFILHILIYIIIIIFNFVLINEIIWLKKIVYNLYLSNTYLGLLFFIMPIISLYFLFSKKLNKKKIILLRKLSILFCSIALILGLFFSIILIFNTLYYSSFYKDCPFKNIISDNIDDSKCLTRLCILNYENLENEYPYEYFCNYNPTDYFKDNEGPFKRKINNSTEIISDYEIICNKYDSENYTLEKEIIIKYLNICKADVEYQICKRFFEPKQYEIAESSECPNEKFYMKIYIFCILSIIFNLILSFVPWRIEIIVYDKIIERYSSNNRVSNSLSSTKDGSKVIKDIKEEKFKKEPTELIIVPNNNNLKLKKDLNNIINIKLKGIENKNTINNNDINPNQNANDNKAKEKTIKFTKPISRNDGTNRLEEGTYEETNEIFGVNSNDAIISNENKIYKLKKIRKRNVKE